MVSEVSMATAMSWSRWRVASASHSLLVYLAPECLTWLGECEISEEFVRREPSENLPERLSPNVAKSSQVMLIKAPHLLFVSLSLSGTWSVRTLWLTSRRSRRSTAAAWKRDASPAQTQERTPSSDSMLTFTASLLFESSPLQPSRGGSGSGCICAGPTWKRTICAAMFPAVYNCIIPVPMTFDMSSVAFSSSRHSQCV